MNLHKKKLRAKEAVNFILDSINFKSILDIGAGYGIHSDIFKKNGKSVTSTDLSPLYKSSVVGNYLNLDFEPHDITWASHVLEHQINVNYFLRKVKKDTKEGGYTCITVPPAKNKIVGGHVTLWNAGLLMYNLVLAGFNCKNAHILTYGYNITVIARSENFELPKITFDAGDITLLKPWLPDFCNESFNGNISKYNWT